MNNRSRFLALCSCTICAAAASAQTTLLARVTTDHKLTAVEAAAAIVIADALGIKMDLLVSTRRSSGESFVVLGPALIVSRHSGHKLDDVLRHKRKGEGWGNVAKSMGMHPGNFNKMRVKGGSFETMCWMNLLHSKYGFPREDYERAKKHGLSDNEIVLAAVMCDGQGRGLDVAIRKVEAGRKEKNDEHGHNGDSKGKGKSRGNGH